MSAINQSRRQVLKLSAIALASIPVVALAAKNDGLRKSMGYVDKATDPAKRCDLCLQWVPGADAKALGGCKIFAGDTEIAPGGTCNAWAKK